MARTREKLAATILFSLCTGSVLVAQQQIKEYNLSIYLDVGLLFWVFIGVVLCLGTICYWSFSDLRYRRLSLSAITLGALTVTLLPIIRGYYFYGFGDSLTHLGWTIDIQSGSISPFSLLYPAYHTLTIIISSIAEVPLRHSLLFLLSIFLLLWVLGTGLLVRSLESDEKALEMGIFAGLLFLPLQPISVFPRPHPATAAILTLPWILWTTVWLLRGLHDRQRRSVIVLLSSIWLVVLHPQHGLSYLLMAGLISTVWMYKPGEQTDFRNILALLSALGVVLVFFLFSQDQFTQAISVIFTQLFTGVEANASIGRGSILNALGTSVPELVLKITGQYVVAASLCTLSIFYYYKTRNRKVIAITFSGIPIALLLIFFGGTEKINQATRYMSVGSVILTTLLGLAFYQLEKWRSHGREKIGTTVFILGFVLLFVLSATVVFPSPYVSQPNQQVTASQLEGYNSFFEVDNENIPYVYTRSDPYRYHDASAGVSARSDISVAGSGPNAGRAPDHFANRSLTKYYSQPVYLAITSADRKMDVELYEGYRFNNRDFRYLDSQPGISKVYSSNGTTVYIVD